MKFMEAADGTSFFWRTMRMSRSITGVSGTYDSLANSMRGFTSSGTTVTPSPEATRPATVPTLCPTIRVSIGTPALSSEAWTGREMLVKEENRISFSLLRRPHPIASSPARG